ncbi:Glycosyltransferase sugar-binding region containing DXD motif [Plasmodiophora brassicae]
MTANGLRYLAGIAAATSATMLVGILPVVLHYVRTAYYPLDVPSAALAEAGGTSRIPRIIHQVYKTNQVPDRWQPAHQLVREQNADYEIRLWSDNEALAFLRQHYPDFVPVYVTYPYDIQRADAIRYFLIYHFGGVYMDLDIGCNVPVSRVLNSTDLGFLAPETWPAGFSNDLFAAVPNHPLSRLLINALPYWNHRFFTKYPTVFMSTGPAFFSYCIGKYIRALTSENKDYGFASIPKHVYAEGAHTAFRHYKGSSWHGDDVTVAVKSIPFLVVLVCYTIIRLLIRTLSQRCACANLPQRLVKLGLQHAWRKSRQKELTDHLC